MGGLCQDQHYIRRRSRSSPFPRAPAPLALGLTEPGEHGPILAATLLIVSPWLVRNRIRYDAWFPLATSNAFLWQGSPEYYHLLRDQGYTYRRYGAR